MNNNDDVLDALLTALNKSNAEFVKWKEIENSPFENWRVLAKEALLNIERDRKAILEKIARIHELAGNKKVDFTNSCSFNK